MTASQIVLDFLNRLNVPSVTNTVLISDNTNYATIAGATRFDALIQRTNPAGIIDYATSGYSTDDYTSPDILTGTLSKSLALPVDVNGVVLTGNYTYGYKVKVTNVYTISDITASSKSITLRFNDASAALAAFPFVLSTGTQEIADTSSNDGNYTILSKQLLGSTIILVVSETVTDEFGISGTFYQRQYFTTSTSFTLCFTEPTQTASKGFNCLNSRITITDLSSYTATNNGVGFSPDSLTRLITLNYPLNSSPSVNPVTSALAYLVTAENAWSGDYPFSINSSGVWTIQTGVRVATNLSYTDTLEGVDDCATCICNMLTCITTIGLKWNLLQSTKPGSEEELYYRTLVLKLVFNYMKYTGYMDKCGDVVKANEVCAESQALVAETGLGCCTTTTDTIPHEIIPLYITSGATGSTTVASADGSVTVTATPTGYDVAINWVQVQAKIDTAVAGLELEVDGITGSNCFGITDGMSLTEALNAIIAVACPIISQFDGSIPDFPDVPTTTDIPRTVTDMQSTPLRQGAFRSPFNPYVKSAIVFTDVSGGGASKVQISASEYYTQGYNKSLILQTVNLNNNQDNYVYLDTKDNLEYAVAAVALGGAAPTPEGDIVVKITTGAGTISSITQVIPNYPINETIIGTFVKEVIHPSNFENDKDGNWKWEVELATGDLVLYCRESGVWKEKDRSNKVTV